MTERNISDVINEYFEILEGCIERDYSDEENPLEFYNNEVGGYYLKVTKIDSDQYTDRYEIQMDEEADWSTCHDFPEISFYLSKDKYGRGKIEQVRYRGTTQETFQRLYYSRPSDKRVYKTLVNWSIMHPYEILADLENIKFETGGASKFNAAQPLQGIY